MSQEDTMLDLVNSLRLFGRPYDIPPGMDPMDYVELAVSQFPAVHAPVVETFTPGLYSRKITMFAGSIIVSEEHLFEHQFVVLSGEAAVWTKESGMIHFIAPHVGITKPGTKRILFIPQDCEWITFHVTDLTDSDEIRKTLVKQRTNPLLGFNPSQRRKEAEEKYLLQS